MFKKLALSFATAAVLAVSCLPGVERASACRPPATAQLECSDPGRSCSVDRNCCSNSCSKGTCD